MKKLTIVMILLTSLFSYIKLEASAWDGLKKDGFIWNFGGLDNWEAYVAGISDEKKAFPNGDGILQIPGTIKVDPIQYNAIYVRKIEKSAFKGSSLKGVVFPQELTDICEEAFAESAIEQVSTPRAILSNRKCYIRERAFENCHNLKKVTLRSAEIHANTFSGCENISTIIVSSDVEIIREHAFDAVNTADIIVQNKVPTNIKDNTFSEEAYENSILYVYHPDYIDLYKNAPGWRNFKTVLLINARVSDANLQDIDINVGESKKLSLKLTENSLNTTTIPSGYLAEWSSDNPEVASVDNGIVTGNSIGTAHITAIINKRYVTTNTVTVVATPADSISLNMTEATLKATETTDLVATVFPENTTDKSVTWKSSDENIATVDANGKVTAVAIGNTVVTATAASGVSATCKVTVVETPASDIIIDKEALGISGDNLEMHVGDIKTVKVTVAPETTTDKSVTYESSNPEVASIDTNGNITALSLGSTTITISAKSGVSAYVNVDVFATPADSISLNMTEATLKATETTDLVATVFPENTTDKSVTWKSSDENIATVDANGKVTAVAIGNTVVTATAASGVSATCKVTVVETPASDIIIDKEALGISGDNLEMHVGDIKTVKVTVAPETTTDKSVTYESSNPDVASVDSNGNIFAIAEGNCTIILSCGEISEEISVTVSKRTQSITWEQDFDNIRQGEAIKLTATASSGLEVEYSVIVGDASIVESNLTINLPGEITVEANQSGNNEYLAAESVKKTFNALSGINFVVDTNSRIQIVGNELTIKSGAYALYDLQGHIIKTGIAPEKIILQSNTAYILRLDSKTIKFIIQY